MKALAQWFPQWFLGVFLLGAASAQAEDIEGVVKVAGSASNAYTFLGALGADAGPRLCSNDVDKSVRRLAGMTVKASGQWQLDKQGEKSCFESTEFKVVKASSGRDAVVGTLSRKDGVYVVTGSDGSVHSLGSVPGGLKKLDGQKVILDIKPLNSPTAKEAVYKVVTYSPHP